MSKKDSFFQPGLVNQCINEMTSLIDGIMNEKFGPTPGYNTCRFCDYQSICEAKEVEGEED
jgi:hypothetical protein